MAARRTFACLVFVVVFFVWNVDSQTTLTPNGTGSSTSDSGKTDGLVLDKSMGVLYDMVKAFLGVVQSKNLTEQSWFNITTVIDITRGKVSNEAQNQLTNWKNYTDYLIGFAVCIAFGIIFIIVMPIVGCCVCCCRCCGRCGGAKKVHDPKHAKCKRISYCTVMLILTTVMLAGVVCAFVSNDLIHKFLRNEQNQGPVGKLDKAFTGFNTYVDHTIADVKTRALDAFDRTRNTLVVEINTTASSAVERVANSVNTSTLITQTEGLSRRVNRTEKLLDEVAAYLTYLQNDGVDLNKQLGDVKQAINTTCQSSATCPANFSQYETEADFSKLDRLQTEITKVQQSISMQQYIDQANQEIDRAKQQARHNISDQINSAVKKVDQIRGDVKNQTDKFSSQFKDTTNFASSAMKSLNVTASKDVQKIFDYIWYGGIGLCSVYLLIIVCYYLGVLFGLCGERPGYDAPCCHKGVGSNFLLAGVGFSFIFSWLLMLLVVIFFAVGGVTYTQVCRYFDTHEPSKIRMFVDPLAESLNLSQTLYQKPGVRFDLVQILENCKNNQPVYKAMKLDNLFNLSSIIDLSAVDRQIDNIASQNITVPTITILNTQLRTSIQEFGNAGLKNINFTEYRAEMSKKLTRYNLTMVADELDRNSANLAQPAKGQIAQQAQNLRTIDSTIVVNMTRNVENLNRSLTALEAETKGDIKGETDALIASLNKTQMEFNANSNTLVNQMVTNLTRSMKATTRASVQGLISDVENEVGRCKPVFDSIYGATDAVCVTALNPFNALWFSWGWCLFFFIPSIVFALLLAGLYRREEEYSEKDFDETNFSMYGGPSPDTIPLTSRSQW